MIVDFYKNLTSNDKMHHVQFHIFPQVESRPSWFGRKNIKTPLLWFPVYASVKGGVYHHTFSALQRNVFGVKLFTRQLDN